MQSKRIGKILDDYNCEVAFNWTNKIAFRYYGIRYMIQYKEDTKTYSFRKYGSTKYICENKKYSEFKDILVAYLECSGIY